MYAYVRKISSTPTHFFHNMIKGNGRDVGRQIVDRFYDIL